MPGHSPAGVNDQVVYLISYYNYELNLSRNE